MSNNDSITVHKEGEEGTIQVDRMTGKVLTHADQRPSWADGLANALVGERMKFYEKRLGNGTALENVKNAQAIEYSDLGWIGLDAEQEEVEIEANPEFRMTVIGKALGIDEETGETSGTILAEREVSRENRARTDEETAALTESLEQGFGKVEESAGKRKAGATR